MLNSCLGVITSIKTITKKTKDESGEKMIYPFTEFKVETSDVDYEILEKNFKDIHSCITSCKILDKATFNFSVPKVKFTFIRASSEQANEYEFNGILLDQVSVSMTEGIPTWCFVFIKQVNPEDSLISNLKNININFSVERGSVDGK
jgi:hypothetical protein